MKQTTTRKNKTNQTLNIPTTAYYTLKELFATNRHFNAEITIRVRHTKEIENGKIVEIGYLTGGLGRPQSVYALTPVSKHTLEQANANNIQLKDLSMTKNMTIPAMDVNSPVKQAPKPLAVVTSAVN